LITATLLTVRQMDFIRRKDPGFVKEGVMVVSLNGDARTNFESLKNEWLRDPGVLGVTTSSHVPTRGSNHEPFKFEGNDERQTQVMYEIDKDFVSTYGLQLSAGAPIRRPVSLGSGNEVMISELSGREIGYASPGEAIGKTVEFGDVKGVVAGVVKDMNIYSLHQEPYPIAYLVTPIQNHNYLSLRLRADGLTRTVEGVGRIWKKIVPGYPLDYFFMDESFQAMHRADQNLSRVVSCFAALTIFVACLGLFALAAFTAEQKTKEIGIRKVLGARSSHIYFLLSKEFIRWVVLANAVALPASLWLMHQWLRKFAYRTPVSPWLLILTTLVSLAIAQLTISYQSLRSARSAPAKALKYE
jgi:putative ABC transport system permease protein